MAALQWVTIPATAGVYNQWTGLLDWTTGLAFKHEIFTFDTQNDV